MSNQDADKNKNSICSEAFAKTIITYLMSEKIETRKTSTIYGKEICMVQNMDVDIKHTVYQLLECILKYGNGRNMFRIISNEGLTFDFYALRDYIMLSSSRSEDATELSVVCKEKNLDLYLINE